MSKTTIETHPTGTYFDYSDPRPEMIHVEDIARALSQTPRFGGHQSRFYSVAEHALLVHRLVGAVAGPELAFAALHHDSHEAYLGDIPTPLKALIGRRYATLARVVDLAIAARFDMVGDACDFHHDIIKAADEQALRMEASRLKRSQGAGTHWSYDEAWPVSAMPTGAVTGHAAEWAEALFLQAHRRAQQLVLA
jgi:hypothetical protein